MVDTVMKRNKAQLQNPGKPVCGRGEGQDCSFAFGKV